jgi:hypothetical protein
LRKLLLAEQLEESVALLCVDSNIKAVCASTLGREAELLFGDCCGYVECDEFIESLFDV